jgi:4-amino-4-deoxy-L-arabinose transferase-like glycosyltransferase
VSLQQRPAPAWRSDTALLVYIAAATVVVHWITGHQYGFQRDELATLEDARHLAWGFVAYPPMTPFFGRLSLILFGTSLAGFRLFAAIAQAVTIVLTGWMAREMGGARTAQLIAAVSALPFCIGGGVMMQYVAFDTLCWVLAAYLVVKLLKTGDARWWLAIGAAIGFGFEAKYTIGVFALAIATGALLTDARRFYASKWLWRAVALAVLIFLPNILWQAKNHFISLQFLQHIHQRDVGLGRARNFLAGQLILTQGGMLVFLAGLYYTLLEGTGKRFRMIGWMYLLSLAILLLAKGRAYYLAAAYPMMYAAGAVWMEGALTRLAARFGNVARVSARTALWIILGAGGVLVGSVTLPIAPPDSAWTARAMKVNEDFREQIGWPELVETVAKLRDRLPAEDQAHLGILAANYGEAGALALYGPQYGLPRVISGVNSFWARGYGDPPPQTLIVLGENPESLGRWFESCQVVAQNKNRYGIVNEESRYHRDIYLCRKLRQPWPEFWKKYRNFG